MTYPPSSIDRGRLAELTDRELRRFADGRWHLPRYRVLPSWSGWY